MQGYLGKTIRRKLLFDQYEGGLLGELSAKTVTYRTDNPDVAVAEHVGGNFTHVRCLAAGETKLFATVDYGDGIPREVGPVNVSVLEVPKETVSITAPPAIVGPVMMDPDE